MCVCVCVCGNDKYNNYYGIFFLSTLLILLSVGFDKDSR